MDKQKQENMNTLRKGMGAMTEEFPTVIPIVIPTIESGGHFIIIDPTKNEFIVEIFQDRGYKVKLFNLNNKMESDVFNPYEMLKKGEKVRNNE